MKIGIDCRLWQETGVGRYIRNLVIELAEIDQDTEYVLFFCKEEFETAPLPGKNFRKVLANIRWHTIDEQIKLGKILEKEKCDLIHFPYFSYPVSYRKKFVITIHDLIIDHFATGKASTLPSPFYIAKQLGYRFVLHQAITRAQKILTVSGATKQEIVDHYHPSPDNVVITYEGVDKKVSRETEEKIDVRKPFFFSVGNAYPHKNLERLVDAFEMFHGKNPDAHYIFVGKEDHFSQKLEKLVAEKGLLDSMQFYKHVNDGQLAYLYRQALAVVVPSLMEGFGLPALEAMSNECLVLCSEIPAFLEVCGSAPVYFDPYNVLDIAEKLEMAYKKKIAHLGRKKEEGLHRAKEFSWKKMAQQTKMVYEQSISKK